MASMKFLISQISNGIAVTPRKIAVGRIDSQFSVANI
jgi:hypothetical protein